MKSKRLDFLRHTFAAWSLTLGIDMNKLVRLMGHGSKKMVHEVCGDYIEGLEEDAWKILEYFGRDFLEITAKRPPHLQRLPHSGNMVIPASYLRLDDPEDNQTESPDIRIGV
jgi:integrase